MKESTGFRTLSRTSEAEIRVSGSKFLAFAYPVTQREDIESKLHDLRKRYPDATHHCYAWITGVDSEHEFASDDGEPSNSAGQPILRRIRSAQLTHTLVVVVRYFGGKKLGIPGLIDAYGSAAQEAIEANVAIEKEVQVRVRVRTPLGMEHQVYIISRQLEGEIIDHSTEPECSLLLLELPKRNETQALNSLKDLHNFDAEILDS